MSTSGGATWKQLDKSLDDGYALAVSSVLYQAGVSVSSRSASRAMAVSKSNDGKKWEEVTLSKEFGSVKAIAVHPRDKKLVFAGGQSTSNRSMGSRFFRSTDAGSSWSEVAELAGKGACVNGVEIDPARPNRILAALDSGVFVSEDTGKTWLAPTQTIPATCIVADPGTKGRFFAGSTQGVWVSTDGGKTWNEANENIPSRAIACMAFDQKNSILFAGGAAGGVMRLKLGGTNASAKAH